MAKKIPLFSQTYGSIDYPQERWLSNRYPEVNRWAYITTVRDFNRTVKIVAGEANGKIFDREEFVGYLGEGLRNHPQATVTLVFHKEEDESKARLAFKEENPLMTGLKHEFPERVHIYWASKRPRQHYAIVDEERVIFEQPNHPAKEAWWGNIVEDISIAQEWEKRFDEYVRYCSELQY